MAVKDPTSNPLTRAAQASIGSEPEEIVTKLPPATEIEVLAVRAGQRPAHTFKRIPACLSFSIPNAVRCSALLVLGVPLEPS